MNRKPMTPFLILTIFVVFVDLYSFKGLRLLTIGVSENIRTIATIAFWSITFAMFISMVVMYFNYNQFRTKDGFSIFLFMVGFFVLFYIPKLHFLALHFVDDLLKLFAKILSLPFSENTSIYSFLQQFRQSKFISFSGFVIAVVVFFMVLHGIIYGRFNYTVNKHQIYFNDLPAAFDGFRIAQISDIHTGSFLDNKQQVKKGIELLKEQKADIVCITGDIVNYTAKELNGWEKLFKDIDAPYGKYAVMGNHDYGDYVRWYSKTQKEQNMQLLMQKYNEMGFELLLNDAAVIEKDSSKIAIVGAENWGAPPFPQYGDIDKAVEHVKHISFKILLSHDPTHWEEKIIGLNDIKLTLSGHTHGMQFAFTIGGFTWSPVKLRYPRWHGLHKVKKQYLYVSTGFGYIAFPGRVGTPPEIAVFELKTKK